MVNLTNEQVTKALFMYRKLPLQATDVIEHLAKQHNKSFLGGFRELARTLKNKQPKNSANYAKMCHMLEELGIITIMYNERKRPLKLTLNEDWILRMIGENNDRKDSTDKD